MNAGGSECDLRMSQFKKQFVGGKKIGLIGLVESFEQQ
jgi:hypothetical protein